MAREQKVPAIDDLDMDDDDTVDAASVRLPEGVDTSDGKVLPPLVETMRCNIFIAQDGTASILHEKILPGFVAWVEYDVDVGSLTIITWDGDQIPYGSPIPPGMGRTLRKKREIQMALFLDGRAIVSVYPVPFLVRHIYGRRKTKKTTEG